MTLANLERHVACPPASVDGTTVRELFEHYFTAHPGVRGYVVDEEAKGDWHRRHGLEIAAHAEAGRSVAQQRDVRA